MDKIYSRRRWKLPLLNQEKTSSPLGKKREKKIKILAICLIALMTAGYILKSIIPIYDKMCEAEAKSVATKISNEQATIVMKNYDYNDIFEISKDTDGNITGIKSNVITINEIISDVAIKIQTELDKIENQRIKMALGSFTGSKILSGVGPKISLQIQMVGDVDTDFRSEFKAAGINQTLHRLYLQVNCKVAILTPVHTIEKDISNQLILAENVIVGKIPSTYYNLEGMNTTKDLMEIIE